jgi:hypothetical protein
MSGATAKLPAFVPFETETASQGVDSSTVHFVAPRAFGVMPTVCGAGALPPATA